MAGRATWISERRRIAEERMDRLWAPVYDDQWGGYINPTHRRMVERLLALAPARPRVLDAACGTGKYWPLLLGAGAEISGIDMSSGMLRRAAEKFPAVPTRKLGLQELDAVGEFDVVICMDAMEMVAPEDWPVVLANFRRALQPAGLLCVTVEVPEPDLPEVYQAALDAGLPVVPGEYVKDGTYHYYPELPQVRAWLAAAGFSLLEESEGDGYYHLLAQGG